MCQLLFHPSSFLVPSGGVASTERIQGAALGSGSIGVDPDGRSSTGPAQGSPPASLPGSCSGSHSAFHTWDPSPLPEWQPNIQDELWRTPGHHPDQSSQFLWEFSVLLELSSPRAPCSHLLLPAPFPLPAPDASRARPGRDAPALPPFSWVFPPKPGTPPSPGTARRPRARHREAPGSSLSRGASLGASPGPAAHSRLASPLCKQETLALC